jgi:hypothetical protein
MRLAGVSVRFRIILSGASPACGDAADTAAEEITTKKRRGTSLQVNLGNIMSS